jgi:hypothetical protein
MSAKAKVQFDFTLQYSTTQNGSYTTLCACRIAKLPPFERVVIRVDELDDEWEVHLGGKKKIGDLSFEALLTEDNHEAVFAHFDLDPGSDNYWYQVLWPLESGQSTATKSKFQGILKMIDGTELSAETTSAATIPFTIQGSGAFVHVPAT